MMICFLSVLCILCIRCLYYAYWHTYLHIYTHTHIFTGLHTHTHTSIYIFPKFPIYLPNFACFNCWQSNFRQWQADPSAVEPTTAYKNADTVFQVSARVGTSRDESGRVGTGCSSPFKVSSIRKFTNNFLKFVQILSKQHIQDSYFI